MDYTASITSQGQLTIPKPLRDKYGLKGQAQAVISDLDGKLVVRTYTEEDFWKLAGILKNNPVVRKNRGRPLQKIIEEENQAIQKAIAQKAVKGL